MRTELLPLQYRVMTLFDSVEDDYHVCGMDNMYNCVTFCKRAWNHKWKLKVHDVRIKGMRGITGFFVQEEQKSRKKQLKVRGTTKAAIPLIPFFVTPCTFNFLL